MKVEYRVEFGKKAAAPPRETTSRAEPPSRAARMLALAHHVERLVEDGTLRDYAEAAGVLGITRARMAQVMNLLSLSPELQEAVVCGRGRYTERKLRPVAGKVCWWDQGGS